MPSHTPPPKLRAAAALLVTLGVAVAAPVLALGADRLSAQTAFRDSSGAPALSGGEDSLAAARLGVSATAPSGRWFHAAILDSLRRRMLMFGGHSGGNELWALSLDGTPAWQLLSDAGPWREGHVAILDPVRDRIVVFGGRLWNDVWVFPLSQNGPWSQLAVVGTPPAPRWLHCGVYDPIRDRLIVFGGEDRDHRLNDVWALSLSGTPTWTEILTPGTAPSPRRQSSAVYDPVRDRMIVIDGQEDDSQANFNDTWALSLGDSPQWTLLNADPAGLGPRAGHSAVYDPARDLIWLFGGKGSLDQIQNDLWRLSLSGTPTWARVSPGGTLPGARAHHSAVLDPSTDRMVVFSGYGAPNDTWFLQLTGVPTWFDIGTLTCLNQPCPRFTQAVSLSATTVELGQSFTVTMVVQNDGTISDDGRIVISFPSLSSPSDSAQVREYSGGDPGYQEHPAGSTVLDASCQPATATYLAVEDADASWGLGRAHTFAVTATPLTAGTFYFYVRCAMHKLGTACEISNAVPPGGEGGYTDQQGFQVRRFAVTVIDTPQPRFTAAVALSATTIELGQSLTITTAVQNDGATSDDGRIVVSFPSLTSPSDSAQVRESSGGDPGYQEHPAGSAVLDASCQPATATYLAVEHADAAWGLGKAYTFAVTATPLTPGTFYFYVRCAMHKPGTACQIINAVPPGGEGGYTDQQGFPVARYAVTVLDTPQPRFTQAVSLSATTVVLGQSFTATMVVRNDGATSDDGRIVVSFPSLASPSDSAQVRESSGGDPGYQEHPAGSAVLDASCQPATATYLAVEHADASWELGKAYTFAVTATPLTGGTFYFYVRCAMHKPGTACQIINAVPPGGEGGYTDQQGFPVARYAVTVLDTPQPRFTQAVSLSATTVVLGQSFTATMVVRNDGATSDDGRIVVSFPSLASPSDSAQVRESSGGDPGYQEHPAGSAVLDASCQPATATYLAVEHTEAAWGLGQAYTFAVTATPLTGGTFYFYVRCAMHKPGTACQISNAVPPGGEGGYTDQQGFPVRRFAVTVIDTPQPRFTQAVSLSATRIGLGESFTATMVVQNDGTISDDGRIVVSFPSLASPSDSAQVRESSGGDPGYQEHPAGSAVLDASCQPATATYLAVEHTEAAWGLGQAHTFAVTATPLTAGAFYFYVRCAMHKPGTTCQISNALPPGGQGGYTDQQGFLVRRFAVIVDTPQPRFTQAVSLSATTVELGQSFTVTTVVQNDGTISDDGRIVISFPSLTSPSDSAQVRESSGGDPGYQEHPAGSAVLDASCQPATATYLAVEHADAAWGLGKAYAFAVTATPLTGGTFYFYVRCAMHAPGTACQIITAVPAGGEGGYTDQQGFQVKRYAVIVVDTPQPRFTQAVSLNASTIALGQSFTATMVVRNDGATSDDGRIVVSFPSLTSPSDAAQVRESSGSDPGYQEHPAGSTLLDASCQPATATYLAVEHTEAAWGLGQAHTLAVTATPITLGTYYFYVRCAMHKPGTACEITNAVPAGGEGGYTDQQGFPVARYAVTVGPPIPHFSMPVEGIPSTLQLGQSFTLTALARNDGGTSDDGRIVVSFPAFAHPYDDQWATSSSGDDIPGYRELPAGYGLPSASCQTVISTYLVTEYDDKSWLGYGAEANDLALTVTPQEAGTFYVDIRATMRDPTAAGCTYVNVLPDSGGTIVVDQQGWPVTRFAVQVLSPPGEPSTAWTRILPPPGGPGPRFGSSVVYHPGRDALVLYGGSTGPHQFLGDSWVLPLAPGGSWTPLVPGGPSPRARINQSTILNPVEDQLVIFGGMHDATVNDLTALALSPSVWWFPATPSGPQPSPRFGQAAVYDPLRHRMLVIGGYGDTYLNDVWEYRLPGDGTWTQLNPAGIPMPARTLHAAVYDPVRDRVLVFGGDGGTFLNDVWELPLGGTLAWNELHPLGPPPEGRRQHSMIYDPVRDRLVVFGGFYLNRMNDVWALSLGDSPAWTQLSSSTPPPSPRMRHAAVYDPIRDRMVVFGGDVGLNQFSNELWALGFDRPTPTQVSFGGADISTERVRLTWSAPDASGLQADVERSAGVAGEWMQLGSASLEGDRLVFEDRDVEPGKRYGYRLVARNGGTVLDEQWVTVPPRAVLALAGASPNPAPDDLWVAFSLPAEGRATLELFDLKGRMLEQQDVGTLGPGEHRVALSQSRRLPAGVYLVRLIRGDRVLTAKAAVVR